MNRNRTDSSKSSRYILKKSNLPSELGDSCLFISRDADATLSDTYQ
jgi:hypothetical protein